MAGRSPHATLLPVMKSLKRRGAGRARVSVAPPVRRCSQVSCPRPTHTQSSDERRCWRSGSEGRPGRLHSARLRARVAGISTLKSNPSIVKKCFLMPFMSVEPLRRCSAWKAVFRVSCDNRETSFVSSCAHVFVLLACQQIHQIHNK